MKAMLFKNLNLQNGKQLILTSLNLKVLFNMYVNPSFALLTFKINELAMTTSKWEQLDPSKLEDDDDDIDGKPISINTDSQSNEGSNHAHQFLDQMKLELNEERRAALREIELKVVKYQDELESGKRSRNSSFKSIQEQVEDYRYRLLKDLQKQSSERSRRSRSGSRSRSPDSHSSSKRRRSRSAKR